MKTINIIFPIQPKLILLTLVLISTIATAQFTPGNIVIDEVYNASGLTSSGATVYLHEFTTSGTSVMRYQLPATSTSNVINRLVQSGTATSDGQLNNSVDMRYVILGGYDATTSTSSVVSTTGINRILARVDGSASNATTAGGTGTNTMSFTNSSGNSASTYYDNNFRSAASVDGTAFWLGGTASSSGDGSDGIRYKAYNTANATLSTTTTSLTSNSSNNNYDNIRCVRIVNNIVYYSTAAGGSTNYGIYSVGTLPTSGTIIPAAVLTAGTQSSIVGPNAFMIFSAGGSNLVMYIADGTSNATGGVYKYYYNGSSWSAKGSVLTGKITYGLNGVVSGTTVKLYATSTTALYAITDAAGFSATMTGTSSTIATAATDYAFGGLAFSPGEIVTTASAPGPFGNCGTNNISVAFTKQGKFTGTYAVQYSGATGVFPTDNTSNLCSGTSSSSPITATLPAGLATGTGYRLRVVDVGSAAVAPTYYYTQDNGTNITITTGAVILASATVAANEVTCSDGSGWTYYAAPANLNNWLFAIYKNGNTFTANVSLNVKTTAPVQYDEVSNATRKEANYTMGRYWNVSLASGSINGATKPVSVRFFYNPADTAKIKSDAALQAASWGQSAANIHPVQWFKTGSGIAYSPANNTYSDVPNKLAPSTYSITTGLQNSISYVEYNGLTGFSGGTAGVRLSPGGYALPVELLYVTATPVNNNYIQIDWATASEVNNAGFEIERSTDGSNFEQIAWIAGNGNSESRINYLIKDNSINPNEVYYYRLKQIDADGDFEYSTIVSATILGERGFVLDELRPNPATDQVVVNVITQSTQKAKVIMTDMLGRAVSEQNWELNSGLNGTQIDLHSLSAGIYNISVITPDSHLSKKLLVTK